MREAVKNLNKRSLADATGISYSRLRKYASGELNSLSQNEIILIHEFLIKLAKIFIIQEVNDDNGKQL